jgi:hypothetical protein
MNRLSSKTVVLLLCLLPLIPIWSFHYLPLQDYPNHLARLSILSGYDHSGFYKQHFAVHFFKGISPLPYLSLDLFVAGLAHFIGVDTAARVFISLYVILYVFALFLLSRDLNLDFGFLLLLNLPIMYSSFFHFGFLDFLFSIPLFLLALWALLRYRESKNGSYFILLGILSLLIYISHIFTLLIFFLLLVIYLITARPKIKEYLYLLVAVLPSFILGMNYLLLSTNYRPLNIVRYESVSKPLFYKLVLLTSPFSYLPFNLIVVYSILYALVLYIAMRNSSSVDKPYLIFSILLLFIYFVLPLKEVNGHSIDAYYIDVRVLLFSMILYSLALRIKDNWNIKLAKVALYLLFLMSFSGLLYSFSDFNKTFSDSCARVIRQGSTLFPINVMPAKSAVRPYRSAWGYFALKREILTPYLFTASHIPVAYRDRPPTLPGLRTSPGRRDMQSDSLNKLREHYDYVLLIGTDLNIENLIEPISKKICEDKSVKVYEISGKDNSIAAGFR